MTREEIVNFYTENAKQTFLTSRELLKAEEILNKFFSNIDKLKMLNNELSELQIFLYAYEFVCDRMYSKNIINNDPVHALVNEKATIEGYCLLMKLICEKLNIPFFYNTLCKQDMDTDIVDKCSSFQVIVKDKDGVERSLHCDPYMDCPKLHDKKFKYNGTLINMNDMKKKKYIEVPIDKITELFFELSLKYVPFEDQEKRINTINVKEQKLGMTSLDKYNEFKNMLIRIGNYIGLDLSDISTNEDLKYAYLKIRSRLHSLNTPLSLDTLYEEAKEIKKLDLQIKYNLSSEELERYSDKIITSRIEARKNYFESNEVVRSKMLVLN